MVTFAVKNFGVGVAGKLLLEGIALSLTGMELLVKRFRDVRSWGIDLLIGNGLFFLISTAYLSAATRTLAIDLTSSWSVLWHVALAAWILAGMGAVGAYAGTSLRLRHLVLGLGIMASGFLSTGFLFKNFVYSRVVFILATAVIIGTLILRRMRYFKAEEIHPRRLLILGTDPESYQLARKLRQWPQYFRVVGVMAAVTAEENLPMRSADFGDLPVAGLSSLEQTVRALEIEALVLPGKLASRLLALLPRKLPAGLAVQIEVPTEIGPPLLGDVTLDRKTIAELK
jgi:hypothetical protein